MTILYKWLAGAIAILSVVGIIYGKGRLDSKHAAELAGLQGELAISRMEVATEKAARVADTELARQANERLHLLNSNIDGLNVYVDTLQDANRECLSSADTDRLRNLWN